MISFIPARRVSFEVALFQTPEGPRCEKTGNYHNPTHQRGTYEDTGKTLQRDPSLTFRVGMDALRNFKTHSCDEDFHKLANCILELSSKDRCHFL